MKTKRYLTIFCLLLVAALLAAPASAGFDWLEFDYLELYCTYTVGDPWWKGNVYHERDSLQTGLRLPLSEDEPIQVAELTTGVNLNLNVKTGRGTGFGKVKSEPVDIDGAFEGMWNAKLYLVAPEIWLIMPDDPGHAVAHGTGDLTGWKIVTEFYHIDPADFAGMCPDGADPLFALAAHVTYRMP